MASLPVLKALLNLATFFAAFLGLIFVIDVRTGNTIDDDDNLAYLVKHKDDFNIAFAGSSLTAYMIDPVVFDEEMRKQGYETASYNFGTGGSWAHETNYRLRQFLKRRPARLRFLFIEMLEFRPYCDETFAGTERFVAWHDLEETQLVLRAALSARYLKPAERLYFVRKHLVAMLTHYNVVGMAARLPYFPKGRKAEQPGAPVFGPPPDYGKSHGYENFVQLGARGFEGFLAKHRARFLQGEDNYGNLLKASRDWFSSSREFPLEMCDLDSLAAQVAGSEKGGAEPIYVAPAAFLHHPGYPRAMEREGRVSHLIRLDDPGEYPQFFTKAMRQDMNHIGDVATPEYSRLIARKFGEILGADPGLASRLARVPGR